MCDNPLLLREIVQHVLNKVQLPYLYKCRLVCRLWYHAANHVRKTWESVTIMNSIQFTEILNKVKFNKDMKIYKLSALYLNMEHRHIHRLLLNLQLHLSILFIGNNVLCVNMFHKLMQHVPYLERLEIGSLTTICKLYLFPIYDEKSGPAKLMIFHNIETLKFASFRNRATLASALKIFPNLKRLRISNLEINDLDILAAGASTGLEKLEITFQPPNGLNNKHLNMFQKMKMTSLNALKITNFSSAINLKLLKKFVEAQKSTLTTLELFETKRSLFKIFPLNLPNLKKLTINEPFVENISLVCSKLPKLNEIVFIFRGQSAWLNIFSKSIRVQQTVEKCTIFWVNSWVIHPLSKYFPNITFLKMLTCTDEILRAIYSSLPNLEFLVLFESITGGLTQEGFTGIPTNYCLTRLHEKWNTKGQSKALDELRHKPAIYSLKKLKHLIILLNSNDATPSFILFYGILHCPSLQQVTLNDVVLETLSTSTEVFQTLLFLVICYAVNKLLKKQCLEHFGQRLMPPCRGSDSQILIHGAGLFINKRWSSHITLTNSISDRVIYVCLKLNQRYSIKTIPVYAPTSTHDDEEVESFYEDISKAMDENPAHYQFIIGNFNAKLGKREDDSETCVGNFSYDQRNERGGLHPAVDIKKAVKEEDKNWKIAGLNELQGDYFEK